MNKVFVPVRPFSLTAAMEKQIKKAAENCCSFTKTSLFLTVRQSITS
jgi:hypothetical protein